MSKGSVFGGPAMRLVCLTAFLAHSAVGQSSPSPSTRDMAAQLLETARARASELQPTAQASVLFALGNVYSHVNQSKSRDLLRRAYLLLSGLGDNDAVGVSMLRGEVVGQTVRVDPAFVQEFLPSDPVLRGVALRELSNIFVGKKKWDHALDCALSLQSEPDIYIAAKTLMAALPAGRSQDLQRVFSAALAVYRGRRHGADSLGQPEDLATLALRFWKKLPSPLVQRAMDELLDQASEWPSAAASDRKVAVSSSSDSLAFDSAYDFRLFQLLPILRQIDASRADNLESEHSQVVALLKRHPEGQQAFSGAAYRVGIRGTSGLAAAANALEWRRLSSTIVEKAQEDLKAALQQARALPDLGLRIDTLLSIARSVAEKSPTAAKDILDEVLKADMGTLKPESSATFLEQAAKIAAGIGNSELAETAIQARCVRRSAFTKTIRIQTIPTWP